MKEPNEGKIPDNDLTGPQTECFLASLCPRVSFCRTPAQVNDLADEDDPGDDLSNLSEVNHESDSDLSVMSNANAAENAAEDAAVDPDASDTDSHRDDRDRERDTRGDAVSRDKDWNSSLPSGRVRVGSGRVVPVGSGRSEVAREMDDSADAMESDAMSREVRDDAVPTVDVNIADEESVLVAVRVTVVFGYLIQSYIIMRHAMVCWNPTRYRM